MLHFKRFCNHKSNESRRIKSIQWRWKAFWVLNKLFYPFLNYEKTFIYGSSLMITDWYITAWVMLRKSDGVCWLEANLFALGFHQGSDCNPSKSLFYLFIVSIYLYGMKTSFLSYCSKRWMKKLIKYQTDFVA